MPSPKRSIPLIISIVFCLLLSCDTHSTLQQKDENRSIALTQEIQINNTYSISIPAAYQIQQGVGDDSEFLQVYNSENTVFLSYETSANFLLKPIYNIDDLQNRYQNIEVVEQGKIWIGYNTTNAKLRAINGYIFIQEDDKIIQLLRFESSSEHLKIIKAVAASIK